MIHANTEALPCIVCGRVLIGYEGQGNLPREGVVCFTGGNYGSTVYDSFDGMRLEFNVCDPCIVEAGERGRVLEGRTQRPVNVEGFVVGYEELEYLPVPWTRGLAGIGRDQERLHLDVDEDFGSLPPSVHLNHDSLALALTVIKAEDDAAEAWTGKTS